jgi:hypothetical protein
MKQTWRAGRIPRRRTPVGCAASSGRCNDTCLLCPKSSPSRADRPKAAWLCQASTSGFLLPTISSRCGMTEIAAGLRQCHRLFAHRRPAIERGRTRSWPFKLDDDLDWRVLPTQSEPPEAVDYCTVLFAAEAGQSSGITLQNWWQPGVRVVTKLVVRHEA